jgi:UDP-N-acetylglucosamine transferase subunit ALG13
MILVTVGMQLGFDRLIAAMDRIAPELGLPVIAQTGSGNYRATNLDVRPRIAPGEFEHLVRSARLIVSHAGIGTVLTASRCERPVVLMPRRADLGEHRNDHQMATARSLADRPGILVAMDESELPDRIRQGLALENWSALPSPTVERMHTALARFIEGKFIAG